MLAKAVRVSTLLCCIIQVSLFPCVLGSDGTSSSLLIRIMIERTISGDTSSITTQGPEECDDALATVRVNLTAPAPEAIFAQWDLAGSACQNITGFEVTLSEVGGATQPTYTTENKSFIYSGLNPSTTYQVTVQPLGESSQTIGTAATAEQRTLNGTSANGCAFPSFFIYDDLTTRGCGVVEKSPSSDIIEANLACMDLWPAQTFPGYVYFLVNPSVQLDYLLNHLRSFDYTEDLMVNTRYGNGEWIWGIEGLDIGTSVDPTLLTGVPDGGDGPDDYKRLYLDPTKNFGFSAAKDGHEFKEMICMYDVPR